MVPQPTILLAHAEQEAWTALAAPLAAAGYRVAAASSASECLRLAEELRPPVALLALELPDQGGVALGHRLRAAPSTRSTLAALIAEAQPEGHDAASLAETGIMWLTRPFSDEQLLALVRLLLRAHTAEQRHSPIPESVESLYHTIVQTAIDGFWMVRASDARFLAVNDSYCRISGYSRDELLTMSIPDVEAVEQPQDTVERIDRIFRQGYDRFETHHRRKDGTIIDVEVSVRPMQLSDSVMVVFARDITQRKQAEANQQRLARELVRKNRELEQIVYVASHDLRSPLVNLQGFSHELEASLEALSGALAGVELPPQQRDEIAWLVGQDIPESLGYILTGVSKMDALLKGLLRLSRLGRAALSIEPVDVAQVVAETLGAFDFQIKQAGATVEVGALPRCSGDAVQIGQVFANLVSNALKYLAPGRPGRITITGERAERMAVYCVADNGIGIARHQHDKIFELYYRLAPTQSDGEGLGLTIVRTIVDRHGGWVKVASAPGMGSQFLFALPEAP